MPPARSQNVCAGRRCGRSGSARRPPPFGIRTMHDLASPPHVADFLLVESRERGDVLTNLKLQKLLYYAQAWHLALFDSPIFGEDFQAWVHGPVLPSQYRRFKDYEWRPILEKMIRRPVINPRRITKHLSEIVEVFGSETATALELMTHREKPWLTARKGLSPTAPSTALISKQSMKEYYRHM